MRVGGRAEEAEDGAVQGRCVQRREIRQEAVCRRGRHEDRLGPRRHRRSGIDVIEGIGNQHHRRRVTLVALRGGQQGEEQAFAAAGQRLDRALLGDQPLRQGKAPVQPVDAGAAVGLRAVRRRIARPCVRRGGDFLGDEGRRLVLGFADRQQNGLAAGCTAGGNAVQQAVQLGEGVKGLQRTAVGQGAFCPQDLETAVAQLSSAARWPRHAPIRAALPEVVQNANESNGPAAPSQALLRGGIPVHSRKPAPRFGQKKGPEAALRAQFGRGKSHPHQGLAPQRAGLFADATT